MKILRPLLNALPIGAFAFALLYLWRLDASLRVGSLDYGWFTLSICSLGAVFVARGLIWQLVLKRFNIAVNLPTAFYTEAITVLLKYIPGKVWAVVGKADLIARLGFSIKRCAALALLLQIIMIMAGLMVGVSGILAFNFLLLPQAVTYALLALLLAVLLVFLKARPFPAILRRWIPASQGDGLDAEMPPMADIMLLCILQWVFLGIAYMWFIASIGYPVGLLPILLQPLANNIGILSVFAPGGIGVREAASVGYLVLADLTISQAIAIAVACRFWFVLVEVAIFIAGWIVKKTLTQK